MTSPEPSTPQRHYWMPLLVLALGAGSILLLLANNWIQQSLIAPDIGSLRAASEIQARIAIAHLWTEEFVSGDEVDLDQIDLSLARARQLVHALEVRASSPGEELLRDSTAGDIRALTARVGNYVEGFGRLTRERREYADHGAAVGIGSSFDVEYDRIFSELDTELGNLERALVLRLAGSERRAALLFRSLLIAWSLIVAVAAVGLWTRERRHRLTEAALGASQAQLLQAQKMEAVGRLAGGLAHDINNYLAAIAAQSELVKMKAEPGSSTAKRMAAVLATTGRAGALIDRLLAFSRRQPARPESVDINRIIESLDAMLRQLLGEDIELRTQIGETIWPVVIDTSQLEQVLLNLAVNAREAMTTGGTLTIRTRNVVEDLVDAPTELVELSIEDTGCGIPASLHRKIFEPFFTTKEKTHSGLGLATVLGVVEQNGGRVEVLSLEPGTRFRVLLPRGTGTFSPVPRLEDETDTLPEGDGRILLVEDNAEVRRSTRDLLERWGYSVIAAADGRQAIELFEKRTSDFDLLVTDVVMPGLSGRRLAEKLLAIEPDLPVLYMSGHTDDVVLRHGLAGGEVDLLQKPFSARQLAERVSAVLAGVA